MMLVFMLHIVLSSHLTLNSSFHVPLSNNQSANGQQFITLTFRWPDNQDFWNVENSNIPS